MLQKRLSILVLLLVGGASLWAKSYEERIDAGRKRLAEAARQEAEERPQDAEAYLRAHLLDPSWTPEEEPPESPLLAERDSWAVVQPAMRGAGAKAIQTARDLLDRYDRVAPSAAWVPIDRLLLLCADGMERPGFWKQAAEHLEEASRRSDDLEDKRRFWVRFQDWAAEQETDALVRLDVAFGPGFFRPRDSDLRKLEKRAYGAALARGPADPDLVRLLDAIERYADRRMGETTDAIEFLHCRVVIQNVFDAKALIAFRAGNDKEIGELCKRLDELIHIGEARDRQAHEEYEAHKELWSGINDTEVVKTLTGVMDTEKWKDMEPGEVIGSLLELIQRYEEEPELRNELYRATEKVAEATMTYRREELARSVPLLREGERYRKDAAEGINCLRRLLHDAASLRAGSLPADRLDDMLDFALANTSPKAGSGQLYGYRAWLLAIRDALFTKGAAPAEAIRARLSAPEARKGAILLALRAQGEDIDEAELQEALQDVVDRLPELEFHAYCVVLAERIVEDPAAALEMLPLEGAFVMWECEGMIAQTLRQATGEDHGVVLTGWRGWLAAKR